MPSNPANPHANHHIPKPTTHSTVRLLVSRSGTWTAKLLRLAPSVVCNEERTVVLDEGLLELVLRVLVDVLLVVGDYRLSDGLSDGVDLRGVTTTGDADADVDVGELVNAYDEERLVDLLWRSICQSTVSRMVIWTKCVRMGKPWIARTLKRRISGCVRARGLPLTLTRPLPA